jgi:hypothetical protein
MKLKALHCYQYVRFQNRNENYLSIDNAAKFPGLCIEVLKSGVIRIKSDLDEIVVWPNNVAYGVELNETTEKRDTSNRGQIVDSVPSAPAKRA